MITTNNVVMALLCRSTPASNSGWYDTVHKISATTVVLVIGLVTFGVTVALGAAFWNAVFLAVMLSGLTFVLSLAWRARADARLEQHRAEQLRTAYPVEAHPPLGR